MMSIPKIVSMMNKTARQEMIDAFYMKGLNSLNFYFKFQLNLFRNLLIIIV